MTSSISEVLRAEAQALGFAAFGIAPADAAPETGERLRQWLAEGRHGDMLWMESRADERAHPAGLWPDVRSVIALGLPYTPALDPARNLSHPELATISVYALGRDYHDVVKSKLKALARFLAERSGEQVKVFVDTAPVMEKPLAEAAGLGWQGKHSNLLSRKAGNWLFLGAIYTTADLPPFREPGTSASCGSCTACITACPTQAITAPYRVDARRCISYLTIEHKGPIPPEFRAQLGNRIYGCDDCLNACPWNSHAQFPADPAFAPRAELTAPYLADLLALDDPSFRSIFAGSPIKRIGRNRFVRNCLYAAGNSGLADLRTPVSALLNDPDPGVADAAQWALARLSGVGGE
ncbi:tRNA epoxyqueuosine(34) reductase QueG [Sandaracinobacter neustonicus]|uniref:Epoxyqueuosine reductase n=1 Tax=Sandaracinobacter neustonicus TaxID=1715348 RepID=A0A501XDE2_9SPHN|nr:tRNA epoxyqueuosine(34) reductase QueG [Sandaracinobacter neustonicus]TPE58638.1 tRNA epoxyqueuosine(34) reductase QueG [Sandaracinobacter neustonicus]